MSAFAAIYLRELLILKRRLPKQIAAAAISPLLYLLTFGYALGGRLDVGGHRYIEFLLPGLVAMSSMTQAFAIASEINIARFYSKVFEEIQAAPTTRLAYVLGEICAALTRVALAVVIILALGLLFGVRLHCGLYFWLGVGLNGFTFAALAVALAMVIRSHADQGLLNTFVITPMAFLGGTFFPLAELPNWAQSVLSLLPLTHASQLIRADALGGDPDRTALLALAAAGVAFLFLALYTVGKARD
ncbi:MAG: ABC transporter permease [Planctomycetes bacterium]|nr:ABC transporter permease [Planctomycetota bacterium]